MFAHIQQELTLYGIRAISLDLDNTLWEIDPVISRAESRLWDWFGKHYPRIPEMFSAEDVAALREVVVEKYWTERHYDLGFMRRKVLEMLATEAGYENNLVEPAFRVFDDARNDVELFPEVIPTLEHWFGRYTVLALTNGNANLETIGIRHLFHDVIFATDVGAAKPSRQIFDVAIRKSGVAAAEILHVGDHPLIDVDGGRRAGLKTAWINRNNEEWPQDLQKPDATATNIGQLRELLRKSGS